MVGASQGDGKGVLKEMAARGGHYQRTAPRARGRRRKQRKKKKTAVGVPGAHVDGRRGRPQAVLRTQGVLTGAEGAGAAASFLRSLVAPC